MRTHFIVIANPERGQNFFDLVDTTLLRGYLMLVQEMCNAQILY